MNATNIITAICSLFFLMIGVDKFFPFMEPSCSLMDNIPGTLWKIFGIIELVAGILIWLPTYRKYIAGFFFVFMLVFTVIHIVTGTYDIGGSVFMAILLGLLVWNPTFLQGKGKE